MRYFVLLALLIPAAYATDDEDLLQLYRSDNKQNEAIEQLNSKLCDIQVRVDKLESDDTGAPTKPAFCPPAFQIPKFPQSFTPQQPSQPQYQRPPSPYPGNPEYKWDERTGKWWYHDKSRVP